MSKKIFVNATILKKLYVEKRMSLRQIGKLYHCSSDTIARRLRECGVARRNGKMEIPGEILAELYLIQRKTVKEISERFGCSHTTITNRLRELRLQREEPTRHKGPLPEQLILQAYHSGNSATFIAKQCHISRWSVIKCLRAHHETIRHSHKRVFLPPEEIRYLYETLHKTTLEIAKLYKVKPCTISSRLKEMGCHVRGNHLQITPDEIYETYEACQENLTETAKKLHCSYTTVHKYVQGYVQENYKTYQK